MLPTAKKSLDACDFSSKKEAFDKQTIILIARFRSLNFVKQNLHRPETCLVTKYIKVWHFYNKIMKLTTLWYTVIKITVKHLCLSMKENARKREKVAILKAHSGIIRVRNSSQWNDNENSKVTPQHRFVVLHLCTFNSTIPTDLQ